MGGDSTPQLHGTVPVSDIPKPDIGEKLRHFGAWYLQQYGEPPSREALEHAAAQLAAEAVEEKPSLQSQIKSYEARREPVDPRAQHFVEWYTKCTARRRRRNSSIGRRRRSWSLASL